jgi:hypothetical protein
MYPDPTMARIGEGVEPHHRRGRRETAREHLRRAGERIGALAGDGSTTATAVSSGAVPNGSPGSRRRFRPRMSNRPFGYK